MGSLFSRSKHPISKIARGEISAKQTGVVMNLHWRIFMEIEENQKIALAAAGGLLIGLAVGFRKMPSMYRAFKKSEQKKEAVCSLMIETLDYIIEYHDKVDEDEFHNTLSAKMDYIEIVKNSL